MCFDFGYFVRLWSFRNKQRLDLAPKIQVGKGDREDVVGKQIVAAISNVRTVSEQVDARCALYGEVSSMKLSSVDRLPGPWKMELMVCIIRREVYGSGSYAVRAVRKKKRAVCEDGVEGVKRGRGWSTRWFCMG